MIVNLASYPETAEGTLLAILELCMSLVGTSIVTLLLSSIRVTLLFSTELCGRVPNWELERYQDLPLGCGMGGAEGDRRIEALVASNPEGRAPGIDRAECDMARRFERDEKRNGGDMPTATRQCSIQSKIRPLTRKITKRTKSHLRTGRICSSSEWRQKQLCATLTSVEILNRQSGLK